MLANGAGDPMPKYTKRADGRYSTHITTGTKPDGSPIRKTIYAKTMRGLEERAAELRMHVGKGTVVQGDDTTVAEWSSQWLHTYKSGVSQRTRTVYNVIINKHIVPNIGHIRLKDIKPFHLQGLINDMTSAGLTRTVTQASQTLKQIFGRAVENYMIARNPADTIQAPKMQKPKKRALDATERIAYESAALNPKEKAFLYVLLYAGLRRGEAIALTWGDINFDAKTISVSKTWTSDGNKTTVKPSPKSKAGNRIIPMPDALLNTLQAHAQPHQNAQVFMSAKGTLMSEMAYRRFWEGIKKTLNASLGGNAENWLLPYDITPHIFRHTYATMLFYSGVDVKTAQYLMGHSSIAMTMDIYTHLDKSTIATAADKINTYTSSTSSSQSVVKS